MATPIVAGSAAIARQYFQEGFYPSGERNTGNKHMPSGARLVPEVLPGKCGAAHTAVATRLGLR